VSVSDMPMISIVIPVYNGANYLREAIDSALSQTYQNIEVIVVNDGSTDDGATQEIALSYQDRIRYYRKENGGVSSALNYGIKQMKGEYFVWLSHDDIHLPQKVEKQMDAVVKHKGNKPAICVCNYFLIDETGREFARAPENLEPYFRRSPKCFLGGETSLMIDGDATLISKQVFDICGMFDETLFASQETDMWFRSLNVADFIFIPDYLVGYRSHSQQVTHKRKKNVGLEAGAYRGNLIKQASLQEIQAYYCTEKDALRFGTSAYGYMGLYFYEVAHQITAKLRQLCSMNWEFAHHVLTGMFEQADVKQIQNVLKADLAQTTHKTKILVYCRDWVEGGLASKIAPLMDGLRNDYEFIIAYGGECGCALPRNIPSICLGPNTGWNSTHHATCLALLADLLNVNLLWSNAANFMPEAIAMSYIKDSGIRTIASFHYVEPTASAFDIMLKDADGENPLVDAYILTHEQHDMMFTQYLYPYDAVLLPVIRTDTSVLEKWNRLFQSVLSASENREEIRMCFPHIDGSKETVQPMKVIQIIQPYLEKYADYVQEKYREYYEQSFYWRVTKPLRMISDLFRRLARR